MKSSKLTQRLTLIGGKMQSLWMSRKQSALLLDLTFSEAAKLYQDRNAMHSYMHHHFRHICPLSVKQHRKYFKENKRGFGEDAFHSMWYCLFKELKPVKCLEIGVYRGQAISLWALLSRLFNYDCNIHGISPFTQAGDEVSKYLTNVDYESDTIKNHKQFNLPTPGLLKAFSTEEEAKFLINSKKWDLIYIDGSHDYEVALSDYECCKNALSEKGILVIDDSSLYTDYVPPSFSFAGHPGPSRIVNELAMKELYFVGAVGHNNIFRLRENLVNK